MAEQSFLGTGWGFPPAFGRGGATVVMVSDNQDIEQSLQILLATRLGERVMQDTYGCDLHDMVFEEMDQVLVNNMTRTVSDAILFHEPRIVLDSLDVSESASIQGLLLISIGYTVRKTNSRFNMVYPFYLNEASATGTL